MTRSTNNIAAALTIYCLSTVAAVSLRGVRPDSGHTLTAHRASILHFVADPFVGNTDDSATEYFSDGLLVLTTDGHVAMVGSYEDVSRAFEMNNTSLRITDHRPHLLMPGFVDGHVHYSQETITGAYGAWLLPWLNRYAFPAESQFGQRCGFPFDTNSTTPGTSAECRAVRLEYARYMSEQFINDLLRVGTTTAAVFTTVFAESAEALFQQAAHDNMRLIAGKLGQDRTQFGVFDTTETGLYDTAESFYAESKALIQKWHDKPGTRTQYAVTPRFAPSSTEEQLIMAAKLVKEHPGVYVQTHLAENFDEVALVEDMYASLTPPGEENLSYTEVYDHFGLITNKSLFGHSIHLSQSDWDLLSKRGASVVHCPSSNLFLGSGLFNLGAANRSHVKIAIGSDVGAGTHLSTFTTLGQAYNVASMARTWQKSMMPEGHFPQAGVVSISDQDLGDPAMAKAGLGKTDMPAPESGVAPNDITLSAAKAYYLATLGSAKALSLESKIGNFEQGKEADFVLLDLGDSSLPARRMAHAKSKSTSRWWKQKWNADGTLADATGPTVAPRVAASDRTQLWDKLFAMMAMGSGREVHATYLMGELKHEATG